MVNLRPRRTATRREGIFPSLLWTLTRPDLGQRFWVCNDGESRPDRLTSLGSGRETPSAVEASPGGPFLGAPPSFCFASSNRSCCPQPGGPACLPCR